MPATKGQRRILVVENDAEVLSILAAALRDAGYRVSTAQSRGRALAALRRSTIDLIVADSVLRGSNGEAIAAQAGTQAVPVILISGDVERINRLSGGPTPFLAKPFAPSALLALVKEVIG